jgi:hypothetical protein
MCWLSRREGVEASMPELLMTWYSDTDKLSDHVCSLFDIMRQVIEFRPRRLH